MNAAFTPGPWAVGLCAEGENCWCRIISIAGREHSERMEDCVIASGAVNKRDASLIAAAPDLYEACRYIVEAAENGDEQTAVELATAALAKARGER